MAVKCEICGKEFKNERALNIHMGRSHGGKVKGNASDPKKSTKAGKATRAGGSGGQFVCPVCGRSFGMAMHLARHMKATHGKKLRRKVKKTTKTKVAAKRTRLVSTATTGLPKRFKVDALTIDELLAVKKVVDNRLKNIVQKVKAIKFGK